MSAWWILWVAVALALAWQVRRAMREPHDVGPDNLQLIEDLDTHLDQYFARLSHLFEELGPPNAPAVDAGYERLRNAVREHREEDS